MLAPHPTSPFWLSARRTIVRCRGISFPRHREYIDKGNSMADATVQTELSPAEFREIAAAIEQQVGAVIVGQREVVRLVLMCIIAGGHALLEGVPGLGKTMLIRTLADVLVLDCARERQSTRLSAMPVEA